MKKIRPTSRKKNTTHQTKKALSQGERHSPGSPAAREIANRACPHITPPAAGALRARAGRAGPVRAARAPPPPGSASARPQGPRHPRPLLAWRRVPRPGGAAEERMAGRERGGREEEEEEEGGGGESAPLRASPRCSAPSPLPGNN